MKERLKLSLVPEKKAPLLLRPTWLEEESILFLEVSRRVTRRGPRVKKIKMYKLQTTSYQLMLMMRLHLLADFMSLVQRDTNHGELITSSEDAQVAKGILARRAFL